MGTLIWMHLTTPRKNKNGNNFKHQRVELLNIHCSLAPLTHRWKEVIRISSTISDNSFSPDGLWIQICERM
jgi:hypothetical protein